MKQRKKRPSLALALQVIASLRVLYCVEIAFRCASLINNRAGTMYYFARDDITDSSEPIEHCFCITLARVLVPYDRVPNYSARSILPVYLVDRERD
ncbi:hypothetical protein BDB00DRAFT_800108 [Zychaea mexicana]|uniref:uncharacterized protein n=1 Tax=Zychaea mexicana TaxID=64656 RepID=UPI0022FEB3EC|nr:uncharacterized protein BDB00DRAFT_800108 [Zychaea mexicana]KAI9498390.1 hypothetical protein BDB00DRAFT_800108 [Zychaea mexicana]